VRNLPRRLFDEWYYWAPGKGSGVEVDFILQSGKDLVAIEVKSAREPSDAMLKGLRAVADLPRLRRRLLPVGGVGTRRVFDVQRPRMRTKTMLPGSASPVAEKNAKKSLPAEVRPT
jgi:hypothetical protein